MDRGTRPPEIHYSPEEKDVYYTTAAASAFAVQMSRNHKRDREPAKRHAKRTHNVMRWRTGDMVQRWVASAWLPTEKHFRKVVGHRDLWALALVSVRERKPKAPSAIICLALADGCPADICALWDDGLASHGHHIAIIRDGDLDSHPYWQFIRRLYFYDPVPTLRQLHVPTLAIFGELDNNIVAEKNKAAWEAALKAGGNRDYTVRILPKANHAQFEAKIGSNAEGPSLQRFVPAYFTTIQDWLAKRIRGFGASR